jgi:YesN/AraC family two-component response regulator
MIGEYMKMQSYKASLLFKSPPLPYIVACGTGSYEIGESHNSRLNIGVFDLIIVLQGSLYFGEEDREFSVKAGESFILRPDLYHYSTDTCKEKTLFYWVHFQAAAEWEEKYEGPDTKSISSLQSAENGWNDKDAYKLYNYTIEIPKLYKLPYPSSTYNKMKQLLTLEYMASTSARWQQQIIFEEFLKEIHIEHSSTSRDQKIAQIAEKIANFLRQEYKEPFYNDQLQEIFHFHPNYLIRCMKKVYGCTPVEYLTRYRLEQAKLLLLRTEWTVARIAEEVGIPNYPYFIRCFRSYEGVTPKQFHKKYLKK